MVQFLLGYVVIAGHWQLMAGMRQKAQEIKVRSISNHPSAVSYWGQKTMAGFGNDKTETEIISNMSLKAGIFCDHHNCLHTAQHQSKLQSRKNLVTASEVPCQGILLILRPPPTRSIHAITTARHLPNQSSF